METPTKNNAPEIRQRRGHAVLAAVFLALFFSGPLLRAIDIVNRATLEVTLPSVAKPVSIISDPVTTRVTLPTDAPFQITKQASQSSAAPGQEVLFTLTAIRASNTVAFPVKINVDGDRKSTRLNSSHT